MNKQLVVYSDNLYKEKIKSAKQEELEACIGTSATKKLCDHYNIPYEVIVKKSKEKRSRGKDIKKVKKKE